MMDTPAGPDLDINIVGEEAGVEIRDALLALRMEMRAMLGWLVGLYLRWTVSVLAAMAHGFRWL
jgi:hypothetical protein